MDLTLTEDQEMVQRTAREFLAGRAGEDVWQEITKLGWQALPFEDFGFLEACLLIEELGRARFYLLEAGPEDELGLGA